MGQRIAITGANGAVGIRILGSREGSDSSFVACVRSERAEGQLPPLPGPGSRVARVRYDDASTLRAAFADAGCVIHLTGVLVERRGSTYAEANVDTTRRVVDAARAEDVDRIVVVSAVGADARASNRYYQSKGEAEDLVVASGLAYTILRAPLVLGPGTEGGAALARNAARGSPRLLAGGRTLQQPLDVDDLARGCLRATEIAKGQVLELVGPDSVPEREIVERAARFLGLEVRVRSAPVLPLKLLARLRGLVLGPGFSADAIDVITDDTDLDPGPAAEALGLELTGLDEMVARSVGRSG